MKYIYLCSYDSALDIIIITIIMIMIMIMIIIIFIIMIIIHLFRNNILPTDVVCLIKIPLSSWTTPMYTFTALYKAEHISAGTDCCYCCWYWWLCNTLKW